VSGARARTLPTLGAPARLLVLGLIRLYRVTFGLFLGGRCRFHPSCSAYAEQAVRELGVVRGGALAIWRLLRCGPWTGGGVDYPPPHATLDRDAARSGIQRYDGVIQPAAPDSISSGGAVKA
jgi:putative membrane protein insertion efficiency factor